MQIGIFAIIPGTASVQCCRRLTGENYIDIRTFPPVLLLCSETLYYIDSAIFFFLYYIRYFCAAASSVLEHPIRRRRANVQEHFDSGHFVALKRDFTTWKIEYGRGASSFCVVKSTVMTATAFNVVPLISLRI